MAEETKHTFKCSDIPNRSFKYFEDLKNKKKFCDVTLQVGGESIAAHRIIITAVIPYFRDILTSEKNQMDVSFPDIDPNALKSLIEFAYTCEVNINAENVRNLLTAACYLGVDELRDVCCDFLVDRMEPDNVLDTREVVISLNCVKLLKCTDLYIKRNFEQISQTESFLQCPSPYLKELVAKDDIRVDKEEAVLEAVLKWVKSYPDERRTELPELMRKVRMPLLELLYLTKIVEREEIIRSSMLCRDLIDEAKNYVLFPELRKSTSSFITAPRESTNIFSPSENKSQYICALYAQMKFVTHRFNVAGWTLYTKEKNIFLERGWPSAGANRKMYVFHTEGVTEYDPAVNCYTDINCMGTSRMYATATALNNEIYVCGGKVGSVHSNVVESFDPKKREWTSRFFMKVSCWKSSSVALGEYIFVLGGEDCTSICDTVQRYDSVIDKWKIMPPLLTKRALAGAATLNGKIYICGGCVPRSNGLWTFNSTAEVYDPIQNTSTFISPMPRTRTNFVLLSCHGKLYALNGNYGKSIDVYHPETNYWTFETTNVVPFDYNCCCHIDC